MSKKTGRPRKQSFRMRKFAEDAATGSVGVFLCSIIIVIVVEGIAWLTTHQFVNTGDTLISFSLEGVIVGAANWWSWYKISTMLRYKRRYRKHGKATTLIVADILGSGILIVFAFRHQFVPPFPMSIGMTSAFLLLLWTMLLTWIWLMLPWTGGLLYPKEEELEIVRGNTPPPPPPKEDWKKRQTFWVLCRWTGLGGMFMSVVIWAIMVIAGGEVFLFHDTNPLAWFPFLAYPSLYAFFTIQFLLFFLDMKIFSRFSKYRKEWYDTQDNPPWKEDSWDWRGPQISVWVAAITGLLNFATFYVLLQIINGQVGLLSLISLILVLTNIFCIIWSWTVHSLQAPRPSNED